MLTRRCTQREFRLSPAGRVPLVFAYGLAVVAERYGVEVHVACCMDNHYHLVVSDPLGRVPEFTRDLNSLVARAANSIHGQCEAMWSSRRVSLVELLDPEDIWRKLVYTLVNPAAAGLVDRLSEWPGFATRPVDHERAPKTIRRPKTPFFRKSKMPVTATLRLTIPAALGKLTPKAFAQELRRRVAEREAELRATRRAEGRRVVGAKRLRRLRPTAKPKTRAIHGGRNPAMAAHDTSRRVAALGALRTFRDTYRRALERWRAGAGPVAFPFGTYKMKDYPDVIIAAPPPRCLVA